MIHVLMRGGWVMAPLLVCSVLSVAIVVERLIYFRRLGVPPGVERVFESIRTGRREGAMGAIDVRERPVVRVLAAGLANPVDPTRAMEAAGIAEIAAMRRGLGVLDTIITLSPLLGLLGTILGMMGSFQIMATVGIGQPHAVTGGVAEALIATATGIGVAVASLVPFNFLQGRIERETSILEEYGLRLELALKSEEAP